MIDTGFTSFLGAHLVALEVLPGGEMWVAGYRGLVLASDPNITVHIPGDLDGDGDVDTDDYALFYTCMGGPGSLPLVGCEAADMDGDGDCDLLDFDSFQLAFVGAL
jgi:hypothetical protein